MRINALRAVLAILCLAAGAGECRAQAFLWDLSLDTRFDNREYNSALSPSMTLFGLRAVPRAGLGHDGHSVIAGADVTRNFGGRGVQPDPELILYYAYNSRPGQPVDGVDGFNVYAGAFPRTLLRSEYSTAFFSDSVRFYDYVLEGVLFNYAGRRGRVEFAMDWNSMVSGEQREKFMMISSGELRLARFLHAGYDATVYHHAGSDVEPGVVDNILFYPYARSELSLRGGLRVDLRAGWLLAMQRDRVNESAMRKPGGFMGEVGLRWRWIGVRNMLYLGDDIMPYYSRFGNDLYYGDPFFRTGDGVYDRLEVGFDIGNLISKELRMSLKSIHHYDGRGWNWQQMLSISVDLNSGQFKK